MIMAFPDIIRRGEPNRLVTVYVDQRGGGDLSLRKPGPPGGFTASPGDTTAGLSISDAGPADKEIDQPPPESNVGRISAAPDNLVSL